MSKWFVETIIIQEPENRKFDLVLEIECKSDNTQELFKIVKQKVQRQLKTKESRITICWFEKISSQFMSKYQRYCMLRQQGFSRNQLRNRLNLSFKKLQFFERYYEGKTKHFTFSKYQELKKRNLSDEVIRKRYGVPSCVFYSFIKENLRNNYRRIA